MGAACDYMGAARNYIAVVYLKRAQLMDRWVQLFSDVTALEYFLAPLAWIITSALADSSG